MKQEFVTSVLNHDQSIYLPYQLVLFDFDGTLCHTEGVDIYAIQKTYKALNQLVPTQEMIQAALGKGLVAEAVFQYLSPNMPFYFIQQLLLTYKAMYRANADSAELFSGVIPLLRQLKEAGIMSVVVSNKAIDMLESAVVAMQIDKYFEKIVGVREEGLCKPDPTLYERYIALHFRMIEPHKILMVGDTSTDLKFAGALHIKAAWASYGLGYAESCKALQPAYILHEIGELSDILLPSCEK